MIVLPTTHGAWLEERRNGLGGSDAASYLGMSRYKSNVQLWEEKVGLRQPEDIGDKPYVRYGHDAEPHLRELFALDHPELIVRYESPYKMIRNDEHPFIFATPDGELEDRATGRHGGFECKTTEIRNASQWALWDDRIPDEYYCQVVHQMLAADWEFVWMKAQIKWTDKRGGMRLDTREYLINREDALEDIEVLKESAVEFWRHVVAQERPPLKLPQI